MIYKILGAMLVFGGCGGFGFVMAACVRREERQLVRFVRCAEFMLCELEYRGAALPQLCARAAQLGGGVVGQVLLESARRMELSLDPDACTSMLAAAERILPPGALLELFALLGQTLGEFGLDGQRRGLEAAISAAETQLRRHREGRFSRIRSYQTLGLCAGAALAILFL